MFYVVEFVDLNEVEVACAEWMLGEHLVRWPQVPQDQIHIALLNHRPPGDSDKTFRVDIRGEYGMFHFLHCIIFIDNVINARALCKSITQESYSSDATVNMIYRAHVQSDPFQRITNLSETHQPDMPLWILIQKPKKLFLTRV